MAAEVANPSGGNRFADFVSRLERLDDDEVLDVLEGLQRAQSALAWMESQALVRLAGPYTREHEVLVYDRRAETERVVVVTDEIRDEVAAALHRSANLVHDQISTARLLNDHLADTSRALRDGELTPAQVRVIVEQVRRHPAATHCLNRDPEQDTAAQTHDRRVFGRICRLMQERVLPAARQQTTSQTRALARRTMARIDADGERRRREAARCYRDVWVTPEDDGLATLVARLDAVTAHAIRAAINEAAADPEVAGDCHATIGERRAEALAALVLGSVQVSLQLDLTVPVDALVGEIDAAGSPGDATAALPDGELVAHADLVRLMDTPGIRTRLRRLAVDACTGTAVDLGRSRYEVSEPLRRWIVARDRTCRFPGCRRRASACQIDHVEAWDDGGSTDAANLQALCTRHHQLKTHSGWRVTRCEETGESTWTSPLGRIYVIGPEPVLLPPERPAEQDPDPPPF